MTQRPQNTNAGNILPLRDSFMRHLRAENRSRSTEVTYAKAIDQFAAYLGQVDHSGRVEDVARPDIESFLIALQERGLKPATVAQRYRSLQQFFRWLADEEEIQRTPMERMKPPTIPEAPPPILSVDDLNRLLATCSGTGFEERRDLAILSLLADTGMRRGEIAGLKLDDIDLESNCAVVTGKGRRVRAAAFGKKTAKALDRYIRKRGVHPHAESEWLWLGKRGRFTEAGVEQAVKARAEQAGVDGVHPHRFRHTFAHLWLSGGGSEGDLMTLAGWRSRQMLQRYGASAAADRARAAYRTRSPLDHL